MIWRTKGQLLCITVPEFAQLFQLSTEAKLPRITNTRASRAEIIAKNIADWVEDDVRKRFYPVNWSHPDKKACGCR